MTELLTKAFKKVSKLPPNEQDEIAIQLISDLENEKKWKESLSNPPENLNLLAEKALNESKEGKTKHMRFIV